MRNLKRVLSLALASIMLLGMMVVGASATGYSDFSDKEEIVNKDAVSMLTVLGVIDGKPDGSYAPTENVTRDQMAKMISVIMNQGADVNAQYENVNSGLTDIASNWARGHINYCYTLGIIAGRGDGRFDPAANVTAAEAAKMLLVAAGYDPSIEGFIGGDWAMNVNAKASALGIYENYTGSVVDELNRDNAALLIYNALDIEMIQKYEDGYAIAYNDSRTILSAMYGVYKLRGIVTANEWARLEGTDVDEALAAGKTRMSNIRLLESDTSMTNVWGPGAQTEAQFNVSTPVGYLGKAVTMFVKKTTILADSVVLGVVYDEKNVVVNRDNDQETNKDALKDTGLAFDGNTAFYVNYGFESSQSAALAKLGIPKMANMSAYHNGNGIGMEIIDNDDDGIAEYVLYTKEDLTVVTGQNTNNETTILNGFNDNRSIDNDDIVTELDLEVDNVVLAITYGGRYYVSAPEVVTGEMDAFSSSKKDEQYIEIDGTDYDPSRIGQLNEVNTSANGLNNIIDFDVTLCDKPTGVQFDVVYDFFLDSHGYVRAFRPTESKLPNYALILESGYDPGRFSSDASGKITVLLPDNTKTTYELNFSASAANLADQLGKTSASGTISGGGDSASFSKADQGVTELKGFLGTDYTDNSTTRPWRFGNADTGSTNYTFAFKSTVATATDAQRPLSYRAGKAAGYVIAYTLNTETDRLTITNIIGTIADNKLVNGADGYSLNGKLTDAQLRDNAAVHTIRTQQDTISNTSGYRTGDSRLYYSNVTTSDYAVAIDRNTVAFYYVPATATTAAKYGAAVGYNNMANVDKDVEFMASTVVRTVYNTTANPPRYDYYNTNLADVVLFNQANLVVARDYAFVLSANTTRNDSTVTLNVIFEDGTAGTLVVSRSNYNEHFKSNDDFLKAYAYTLDANNKATISAGEPYAGVGYRLKAGTVALTNYNFTFPYNPENVKIWNVTNARSGQDASKLNDFSENDWNIILVLDTNGDVRTAFVWEYDGTSTPGGISGHNHNWNWTLGESRTAYSVGQIQQFLNDGYDVDAYSNLTISYDLYIPAGRTVRFHDNVTVNDSIYGPGRVWADKGYTTNQNIDSETRIDGTLTASNAIQVNALVRAATVALSTYKCTVNSTGDFHVTGNLTGTGTMDIYGHVDVEGNYSMGTTNVYSDETLIVRGGLTSKTLVIGGVVGGTTYTGKVIAGKDLVSDTTLTVTNGTLTLTGGDLYAKLLNVAAQGTVSGASQAVASGNWTVNGKLDVDGKVTIGDNTLTVSGSAAVVDAKEVTVSSSGTVKTDEGGKITTSDKDAATTLKEAGNLSGNFAGDVTLTGANKSNSAVVVNGKLVVDNSGNTLELDAAASLTLNGKDNDLSGISAKSSTAGAKIIFGSDANIADSKVPSNKLYWTGGSTPLTSADRNLVAGLTFVADNTGKFVTTSSKPTTPVTPPAAGEISLASVKVGNATYTSAANAVVKVIKVDNTNHVIEIIKPVDTDAAGKITLPEGSSMVITITCEDTIKSVGASNTSFSDKVITINSAHFWTGAEGSKTLNSFNNIQFVLNSNTTWTIKFVDSLSV